jgi:hypothetical protein
MKRSKLQKKWDTLRDLIREVKETAHTSEKNGGGLCICHNDSTDTGCSCVDTVVIAID